MIKAFKIFLGFILTLSIATILFMQQKSFGKLPSGEILDRIKKSAQYKNGSFENIEETMMMAADASFGLATPPFLFPSTGRESSPIPCSVNVPPPFSMLDPKHIPA